MAHGEREQRYTRVKADLAEAGYDGLLAVQSLPLIERLLADFTQLRGQWPTDRLSGARAAAYLRAEHARRWHSHPAERACRPRSCVG